jgi:hypothetical protein
MNFSENALPEIDPLVYLHDKKRDILHKFNKLGLKDKEALMEFNWIVDFIEQLRPLRISQSETDEFLAENFNLFCYHGMSHRLTHLIDATENCTSFGYAYNTFVYFGNTYLAIHLKKKQINEIKLLQIIKEENSAFSINCTGLTLSQIALKYVWEGRLINLQNCNDIARQYGFTGKSLYNKYCTYSSAAYRKATGYLTKTQLKNKIKLFESVLELLPENKKMTALQEIDILQNADLIG